MYVLKTSTMSHELKEIKVTQMHGSNTTEGMS